MMTPDETPILLDSAYRPILDPADFPANSRRCARWYLDTGRQCEGRIEWYRRIDARYCSDRCRHAARDQRKTAAKKAAKTEAPSVK